MNSITSTSTTRLNSSSSNVTNSISCVQVGYYDYEDYCEGNLDTRPHCYNSDGSRRKILVFKVIAADCSVGGSNDFIPDAQVWMNNHQNPSNPSSGNYSNGLGGGGENSLNIDIFIPNYFNSEDLSNPSTQNMLQINQFIYNLYASNNTIKGVVESTEWLLAYTNHWIGVNGGLISSNQNALTYAFNNMSSVFYQYPDTINTQAQISLFQYNAFQFLLQHGLWLSGQSETTQQSIKNYLIANCFSDESEEFANDLIDSGYNSNDNTIIYSQTNYPGINDNMPFEWWKDDTYLNNNITLSPTNSNTYPDLTDSEVLLCGLFPLAALTINSNVDNAFNMAQVKLPTLNGRNDKKDAFRHAFFNAINTRDVLLSKGVPGRVIVRLFGKAHEQTNPPGPALEKEMDLFNNDRGINSCTTCYPGIDSDLEIANNIMQLLGGGSLLYLFPLGSDNLIISTTQLIPTNQ